MAQDLADVVGRLCREELFPRLTVRVGDRPLQRDGAWAWLELSRSPDLLFKAESVLRI